MKTDRRIYVILALASLLSGDQERSSDEEGRRLPVAIHGEGEEGAAGCGGQGPRHTDQQ